MAIGDICNRLQNGIDRVRQSVIIKTNETGCNSYFDEEEIYEEE